MEVVVCTVVAKLYFIRGSGVWIAYYRLSKIKLCTTEVNDFQYKAMATKSSILDIAGVPDAPLITIFGKVIFNLTQKNCHLFQFNRDL